VSIKTPNNYQPQTIFKPGHFQKRKLENICGGKFQTSGKPRPAIVQVIPEFKTM
jgi:hypothetical protein